MTKVPKAFISHASEDKERFAKPFAERLRANGVDAWLDEWEIKPGDSLVDKIFEEGISQADEFIIILSKASVEKKWVREELNSGVVHRIEKSCRIIPIVLDDCEIPAAIKHLLWVKIKNLANFDSEFTEIVNTIHGVSKKPPLGQPPKHVSTSALDYLPGLERTDNMAFGCLCRTFLKLGERHFGADGVYEELQSAGFSENEITESLEMLASRGHIRPKHGLGSSRVYFLELSVTSLDQFMRHELDDYDNVFRSIIATLVNEGTRTNVDVATKTGYPLAVVNFVFDLLDAKGLVSLFGALGGGRTITSVAVELKRYLRQ